MAEHHRIENSGSREAPTRTESFSGDRMNLYQGFDQATGNTRMTSHAGGGDAGLPQHLTFDNSIYAGFGDNVQKASLKQSLEPDAPRSDTGDRVVRQLETDATKFAFGDTLGRAEKEQGKGALKTLVEGAFLANGKEGLKDLADQFNNAAIEKYGDKAWDKAPRQFDQSLATVSAKENKDGTTQVQMNFAQPNSSEVNSVIFQVPKTELEHPYPNYFTGNYEI